MTREELAGALRDHVRIGWACHPLQALLPAVYSGFAAVTAEFLGGEHNASRRTGERRGLN
jgi:hypothetical protein